METKGIEQTPLSTAKTQISKTTGTKSGTLKDEIDPNLEKIVNAWPKLPEQVKKTVIELITKHSAEKKL